MIFIVTVTVSLYPGRNNYNSMGICLINNKGGSGNVSGRAIIM